MPWLTPHSNQELNAKIRLPGSKSVAARALVLSLLAQSASVLRQVPAGRDTGLLRDAIAGFGAQIIPHEVDIWEIIPPATLCPADIDVGLSGTVMRFLPPVAAMIEGTSNFYGDPQAAARPIAGLLEALTRLGAHVKGSTLPFSVSGGLNERAYEVSIASSATSQYVSGLLLAGARFPNGLRLIHDGSQIPSAPHIEMTIAQLAKRGVQVQTYENHIWEVPKMKIAATVETIEPDLTNTATFLAAGLVCGGKVAAYWPQDSIQPANELLGVLEAFGGKVESTADQVCVSGTGEIAAVDIDLHEIGEITPVVAALAALADGVSTISGVGHIAGHETNRLSALATELSNLGCGVEVSSSGMKIKPGKLTAGVFRSYADHRMAHAGALLGLRICGIEIDDVNCTAKTLPDFVSRWEEMIGMTE